MNTANLRVAALVGKIAVMSATACFSIAGEATAAAGGTVTFIGAILAPSFAMSVGSAAHAQGSTAAPTQITGTRGGTTFVSFLPVPYSPTNADVSLSVAGQARTADALTASFTDHKGRVVKPGPSGAYFVGAMGGTLSMRTKDDAPPSGTAVTLVTSYR